MANVSLFRRWRSQRFQDLVGQESVVRTLQNVLASGSPARAYLFCGPRGTGKTSSARIFAKALNCERGPGLEPCDECTQCREIAAGNSLDVFEIDAASHTQVDKIRDFIVDKVHFAPVSARHKIYIIDEVHKLSTSSFNALLKTLEEPPSHVVFILATTHPHELPPTILSRCQRYDFRPLTVGEIRRHLEQIGTAEGLSLERDAADQLARAADGSLRDALVLLEQAVTFCGDSVTGAQVLELLGLVSYEVMEKMVRALHACDATALLSLLHSLNGQGRDLKRLAAGFLEYLRLLMLVKVGAVDETFVDMQPEERQSLEGVASEVSLGALMAWIKGGMELANQVREGRQARLLWEMTVVQLVSTASAGDPSVLERRLDRLEQVVKALETRQPTPGSAGVARAAAQPPSSARAAGSPAEVATAVEEAPATATPAPRAESAELQVSTHPPEGTASQEAATEAEAHPAAEQEPSAERDVPPRALPVATGAPAVEAEALQPASRGSAPPAGGEASAPTPPEAPAERAVNGSQGAEAAAPSEPGSGDEASESARPGAASEGTSESHQPAARPRRSRLRSKKEFWIRLVNMVRDGGDMPLYGALADARLVDMTPDQVVILGVPEGFDRNQETILNSRAVLEDLAEQLLGRSVRFECRLEANRPFPGTEEHAELVRRASGLFTGEIVED